MVEGYLERRKVERSQGAAEVCASIRGYREKKPNLSKIFRDLTRDPSRGRKMDLDETQARILAQSRARARRAKRGG